MARVASRDAAVARRVARASRSATPQTMSRARHPAAAPTRARATRRARTRGRRSTRVARARANDDDDDDDDGRGRMREDELRAAIDEAREILAEAARMANEQARAELARAFETTGDGRGAAFECVRVEEFLKGKGARALDAERVGEGAVRRGTNTFKTSRS